MDDRVQLSRDVIISGAEVEDIPATLLMVVFLIFTTGMLIGGLVGFMGAYYVALTKGAA